MRKIFTIIASGLGLLALCIIPLAFRLPNPLQRPILFELHDSSHTVLFFIVNFAAMLCFRYCLKHLPYSSHRLIVTIQGLPHSIHTLIIIFTGSLFSLLAGIGIEFIQSFMGRNATWSDVGRNSLGIASAACIYIVIFTRANIAIKVLSVGLAIFLFASAFTRAFPWIEAEKLRNDAFPLLMDFDTPKTRRYIGPKRGAQMSVMPAPEQWSSNNTLVGNILLPKHNNTANILLKSPYPDWSKYQWLNFDIFSPHPHSIKIALAYHTPQDHRSPVFHEELKIKPGLNSIRLQLRGDMEEITKLYWHSHSRKEDIRLYLDNIRLEQ